MIANSRMRELLDRGSPAGGPAVLPADAQRVLDAGWAVGPDGCLLLAAFWDGRPAGSMGTGLFEYEVNDVFIELGDLTKDMDTYLVRAARRGLDFAQAMLEAADGLPAAESLHATISIWVDVEDPDFLLQGATVRFYTRRGEYPRWLDELENFPREAIAVLDRSSPAS